MQEQTKAGTNIEVLLASDEDVILARQKIRSMAQEIGFSMLDQTRIVTAASELARNIVVHGGGGKVVVESLTPKTGIRIVFADTGPGIANLDKALLGNNSTVGTMGLGLSGAKRLMDDFAIETGPGKGTTVTVIKWLSRD